MKNSLKEYKNKKILIIGTGFLGAVLKIRLDSLGALVDSTYHIHKKFSDSLEYDFFKDLLENKFKWQYDFVFLPTKIEFEENEGLLREKFTAFLKYFSQSKLVYISSDGIFSGKKGLYKENDVTDPITLYGKNLEICEKLVIENSQKYTIIRPSYIYGYSLDQLDSRTESLVRDIQEGKEVERFADMFKSPLGVDQVAQAIIGAAMFDENILLHVSGERLSVYDFWSQVVNSFNLKKDFLLPSIMPLEKRVIMLPDTSLDNSLMKEVLGIEPLSVEETFKEFCL